MPADATTGRRPASKAALPCQGIRARRRQAGQQPSAKTAGLQQAPPAGGQCGAGASSCRTPRRARPPAGSAGSGHGRLPTVDRALHPDETGIREDGDERRVAHVERCAHRLDRSGRERLHLLPPRRPRLLDAPGRIRREMAADECMLENRGEQIHRMANRNGARTRCQASRLPPPDHLGRDLTESDRAEVGTQVIVVETRVVKPCLRSKGGGVRHGPCPGYVLTEDFGASVKRGEASGPALPPDLGVEIARVAPRAERSRTIPPALPPPNTPDDLAARSSYLLDAHREPPRTEWRAAVLSPHRTERREGPATLGAAGSGAERRRPVA